MDFLPLLLLLLLRSALVADQWRFSHTDGSVQASWGVPQLTGEERSGIRGAWVWSATKAPRNVELAKIGVQKTLDDTGRLAVRVERPPGSRPPADLRVIAAPISMWRDLPEHALPSWPVPKNGKLALPYVPEERWRLRVAATGEGSWWQDVPPGRTAVVLVSVAARGLDVRVAGPQGGDVAPVMATVRETRTRHGQVRAWAELRGEEGRLSLPGLPDLNDVALTITKRGYLPATVSGRPSELPVGVRLAVGSVLTGRLLDEKRIPFEGAQVRAEAWVSPTTPSSFAVGALTGADGTFTLPGLPVGQAVLSIRAPGYVAQQAKLEVTPGINDLGDRALERGVTLPVRAVDELGTPVAGARLEAGSGLSAVSDEVGIARLLVPQAPLEIRGAAARHRPGRLRLNPPLPGEVRLELARAFSIRGRFIERTGEPVAQGSLHIEQDTCVQEARVADDGRFELDLLPGEKVEATFKSPTTAAYPLTMMGRGKPGEVHDFGDIVVSPGLSIAGQVVDDETSTPVPGAQVWVPRPGPSGPAIAWATHDLLQAETDVDGRFRLSGLTSGTALLRVEASGYARSHVELQVSEEAETQEFGEIGLSRGATLRVHVDAEESETGESTVARADLRNAWLEPDMLTAEVREGTAIFHHLPPGRATVSVLQGRRLLCEEEVSVAPREDEIDLDCRSGMIVTGAVMVGGMKSGAGLLVWNRPSARMASRIENVYSPGGLRQQAVAGGGRPATEVPVGAGGTFATAELAAGAWEVSFQSEAGFPGPAQVVNIPPGERFEIVLTFPGTVLAGLVVGSDGEPVAGARIRELATGATAISSGDGSFVLSGLAPGKVSVQARLEELASPPTEVEIAADHAPEPILLTLSEREMLRIEVLVTDAAGRPAAGAFVFLEEEGSGQRILTTDPNGMATAAVEPPLPVRVRAAATSGAAWAFGAWVNWEAVRDGLLLQLGSGSLVVSADNQSGSPRIASVQGWDLSWLLTILGSQPVVSPDLPLRLDGLPAGSYIVSLDGINRTADVRDGEAAAVLLE